MQVCISNFNFNRVLNYAIWIQFPRPTMVREDRKPSYYEIHLGSKIVIVHRKRHQDGARRIIYGRSKHLINFPIGNGKDRKKKKRWVHSQLHGGIYILHLGDDSDDHKMHFLWIYSLTRRIPRGLLWVRDITSTPKNWKTCEDLGLNQHKWRASMARLPSIVPFPFLGSKNYRSKFKALDYKIVYSGKQVALSLVRNLLRARVAINKTFCDFFLSSLIFTYILEIRRLQYISMYLIISIIYS
jgi:hypothetical protein